MYVAMGRCLPHIGESIAASLGCEILKCFSVSCEILEHSNLIYRISVIQSIVPR